MIKLGIFDSAGFDVTEKSLTESGLSKSELERIIKTKNKNLQKMRFAARLLLRELYREAFGKDFKDIIYGEKGKPVFADGSAEFSISHDGSLCAVALSDKRVGVDIQSMPKDKDMALRVEKRFLSEEKRLLLKDDCLEENSFSDCEIEWSFFASEENCIIKCPDYLGVALLSAEKETTADNENDNEPFVIKEKSFYDGADFLLAWTRLEALAKLCGSGISGLVNVNKSFQKTSFETWFLQHGGIEYAVSLAFKKKE